ncbi:hypothetical protein B0H11DRAFT_194906 [Mycena galericulata]|nr:hypothetical protein B0H11DRAFT_194906 [Mycena galericulata]
MLGPPLFISAAGFIPPPPLIFCILLAAAERAAGLRLPFIIICCCCMFIIPPPPIPFILPFMSCAGLILPPANWLGCCWRLNDASIAGFIPCWGGPWRAKGGYAPPGLEFMSEYIILGPAGEGA